MLRPSRIPHVLIALAFAAAVLAMGAAAPSGGHGGAAARGKYLVTIVGCTDCHTPGNFYGAPDPKRFLSGSEVGWTGPWGVAYARNLTPDPETGIGRWSEDDIVKALRTGVRPDGRALAPIMPYADLAHLSDADAHAIAAYLKTIPAVRHRAPNPVPPGGKPTGGAVTFPPPPEWDVPAKK